MSIWHKISHWLGTVSEFSDTYAKDGKVYSCTRCNTCGLPRDERRIPHMDHFFSNSDLKKSPFEGAKPLCHPPSREFIERLKNTDIDIEFISNLEERRAKWDLINKK